jgi:phospholipid-translocating ATPase
MRDLHQYQDAVSCLLRILFSYLTSPRVLEMHTITYMSAIGWGLSILGWFLFNLVIGAMYKNNVVYDVKQAFIDRFGRNLLWWLVLFLILATVILWEVAESALRKHFVPTDIDTFQALEKDPEVKKRFEDAVNGKEVISDDEKMKRKAEADAEEREREVRELLAKPRVMDEQAHAVNDLHKRRVSRS